MSMYTAACAVGLPTNEKHGGNLQNTQHDTEIRRRAIAEVLAAQHTYPNWIFAPDNAVPATATMYVVYDGPKLKAAGLTVERCPEIVGRCEMPIVFYAEQKGRHA